MKTLLSIFLLAATGQILMQTSYADEKPEAKKEEPVELSEPKSDLDQYLDLARLTYERALKSGGEIAGQMKDWVKEDVSRIGAWKYKVVDFESMSPTELEIQLNELGDGRWNCFWVHPTEKGLRMFFKKPSMSYLRAAPAEEFLKLLPLGGEK
jgi:hypothetical protein